MSIAKTPSAELRYLGFEQTRTVDNLQTIITYQSTEEKLESMIGAQSGWIVGSTSGTSNISGQYGRLERIKTHPAAGPFWEAELEFNQPLSNGITISIGNSNKPNDNSLTVNMLELDLRTHPNYKKIWNYYFIRREDQNPVASNTIQSWNEEEANAYVNDHPYYKWIKDSSELPPEEYVEAQSGMCSWKIEHVPTKPGVEYYVIPTYEVTESGRHKTREKAAWCISQRSGKLRFPQYGDFGLEKTYPATSGSESYASGRRWLCLGGQISYDGKYYIATCTYRWANEPTGWDGDLYGKPTNQEYGQGDYNPILPMSSINNNNN